MAASVLLYIPSPPTSGISIGPVRLHVYGLLIAAGIAAAVWISQKRWQAIGGRPGTMSSLAVWGVPGGLIGARAYSVATSWNADTSGHVLWAFEIWRGGLGIWGGVIGGIALGSVGAYRARLPIAPLLDCVSPAFALAQAIGRWGNYFNQELYGWKSSLPWAVKITSPTATHIVAGHAVLYPGGTTFQPTFLYECIWDLIVFGLVIAVERRYRIRRGYLFAAYAAFYTFGRFFTEYMRIDTAHRFFGLRLNDWTSIIVFVVALAVLFTKGRAGPGDDRAGDPLPPAPQGQATEESPAESPAAKASGSDPSGPIASETASGSGPT